MTDIESALLGAVEHYADVLSTPHGDFCAWRAKVIRAKLAVDALSRIAEAVARARAPMETVH